MIYTVTAFNTATASANKMHDDSVARSFGFRGGLVPGVDVFAYLCHVPAERWGRDWVAGGSMRAQFASPVYDGDTVTIDHSVADDGSMSLVLRGPDGEECATAVAVMPTDGDAAAIAAMPAVSTWPSGEPPRTRPAASPVALVAEPFGQLSATFRADRAIAYLDDIRESLEVFREDGIAHPGWLLRFANWVLTANVELGPWIHVSSDARYFSVVTDGDVLETRALVTGVYEKKGHQFVDLDMLQVVGERVVARTAHTAIYSPRGT